MAPSHRVGAIMDDEDARPGWAYDPSVDRRPALEAWRRAVRRREAVGGQRPDADPRHLWPALVAGRWTLIDAYTADGARHVVAHENPAGAAHQRALAPRERMVLDFALAGHASKWIALELGLSPPTVTRVLQRALCRLGAPSLAHIAGVQAALFVPLDLGGGRLAVATLAAAGPKLGALTPAEIDVVLGALEGRSNAAIAALHGKSARTVAHQLDAVYRKLGVSSRRELLAQLQ